MATVFKRGGKGNRGGYWYFSWFDYTGKRRTKCSRTTDKATAERIAAKLDADAAARRSGVIDSTLERFGIEARRPIAEHVADYKSHLEARQNTARHVDLTIAHIQAIIGQCAADTFRGLNGAVVMQAIDTIRRAGNRKTKDERNRVPMSLRTCNSYLRSIKSFTRWLWIEKRCPDDLLVGLHGFNEETDRRHTRRELTVDEISYLLPFVERLTTPMHNLPGPDRAMLYRLALGTGLRASELRSLKPESFNLDGEHATVQLAAAYSKRRREDTQPLRADLAEALGKWLADRSREERIFAAMPNDTARMLRADLEAARANWIADARENDQERQRREQSDFLSYRNKAGDVADFHSFRHTYISGIVAGGTSVKVAQELARHSTSRLTIDRYAHARLHDLQGALDTLPDFDRRQSEPIEAAVLLATGTDDAMSYDVEGAQRRAQQSERESVRIDTKPSDCDVIRLAINESPDASQVEAPGDVVRASATTSDKRRRSESNRRWRICNPLP